MYQYLFYDYYIVHILATVWDTSTSTLNFAVFLQTVVDPLNKVDLLLVTQSKLLCESSYVKSITEGLSFQIRFCYTQVKHFALSSHTIVDWKNQMYKCNMVYLKYSFIVSSSLFLFIHNIALLQGIVAITVGVGVKNQ